MNEFSIILPVRNGGEYIKECIASILNQTYIHYNLIILDSGSTDNTIGYVENLNDDRIILHKSIKPLTIEENWGRIKDIEKNEFITLIGHDDLLAPNYLQVMNDLINKHPDASLYQSHFNYIDANGNILRICKPMDEVQTASEFLSMFLMYFIDVMGTGFMMRAREYDAIGGISDYPNLLFADFELFLLLTKNGYKATAFENCFSFRLHKGTTSISADLKMQQAFRRFVFFLHQFSLTDQKCEESTKRYSKEFIMFYCKSLSHRLMRTSKGERHGVSVDSFINECKEYADLLLPGEPFNPTSVFSIKLAKIIDSNTVTRSLFLLFKKIVPKPIL